MFCVVVKGERQAAPFVLSRDAYFTSLSHINEIKATILVSPPLQMITTEDYTITLCWPVEVKAATPGAVIFPGSVVMWLLSRGWSTEVPLIKWSKCSLC